MRRRHATLLDFLTEVLRFANNELEKHRRRPLGRCLVCEPSPLTPWICRNCGLSLGVYRAAKAGL